MRDASDNYNICFLDNQSGLHFHEAQLQTFLQGSASVLTIKVFNKKKDLIQTGYRLSFRYRGKDYWMTITSVKKVGLEMELTALGASLEANKEKIGEYKNGNALGIAEYWKAFDDENNFEIGINEVAEKRITAEWSGNETKLARLFSLAEKFDAELEFTTELNDDYSLKRQVVNIYRQGNLGRQLTGHPLRVGKDIESVSFEENIDEIYTEVVATGKDGLTIDGLTKNVYDDNGELLYFTKGKSILASQARQRFEGITKRNELQGYILNDLGSTEYETKEKLYAYMLGEIKKHSIPRVTYEISGFVDVNIGDRLMISDSENYSPTLYLEARVTEQTYDLLDSGNNKSTFSNVVERFSQLNDDILKRVEEMIQNAKLLQVTLLTEDFLGDKNSAFITTKLLRNNAVVNSSNYHFEYRLDNKVILDDDYTGSTLLLPLSEYKKLANSPEQAMLTVTVYDENNSYQGSANAIIRKLDAVKSYTHFAYSDYPDGRNFSFTETNKKYLGVCTTTSETPPNTFSEYKWSLIKGENGIPGKSGYVHIAYANTPDGSGGFSTTEGEGKLYIGTYTDHTEYDSADYHAYTWSRIKGEDGTDGKDGKQLYTWLKYADSPTSGMSDLPTGKSYIGIAYNRETSEESTRYEDYYWSKIKGEDGVAGQRGADGRQYYTWFKYADNPNGNNMSSNPTGKDYIGLAYNKTTPTASNNPQDYTWSLIRGAQGVPGKDGKTPIIHEAWADDENGLNFSIAYPSNRTPKLKGTYTDYSTIGSTNPKMYKWEPNTEFLKREMDLLKKTNEENVEAISRNEEILRNADEAMREMVRDIDDVDTELRNFNNQIDFLTGKLNEKGLFVAYADSSDGITNFSTRKLENINLLMDSEINEDVVGLGVRKLPIYEYMTYYVQSSRPSPSVIIGFFDDKKNFINNILAGKSENKTNMLIVVLFPEGKEPTIKFSRNDIVYVPYPLNTKQMQFLASGDDIKQKLSKANLVSPFHDGYWKNPKYIGFSDTNSNNAEDYKWSPYNPLINEETKVIAEETTDSLKRVIDSKLFTLNGDVYDIRNSVEQTADEIRNEVSEKIQAVDGKITTLGTQVTQTAEGIKSELSKKITTVDGRVTSLNNTLTQTAEGIRGEVTQKISGVDGKITTLGTQVDQTANSWAVKYVKSAKDIVTQINANPKGVYIKGKNISLDGDTYITNGIIKNAHIGDAQITNAKIGIAAITNAKIADAAITNAKIHDLSADKITAGYIDSARIKAESITADKIDVSSLSALSADLGDIRTGRIRSYDGNFDINANNGTITSVNSGSRVDITSGELTIRMNGNRVEMDDKGLVISNGYYFSRIQPHVIDVNGAVYAGDYFRNANTYVPFADIVQSSGSGSSKVKELLRLGGSSNPYLHIGTDGGNYGVTAWSSDEKLKENIYRTNDDDVVEKIKKVNVYSFDWKADGTHTDYGFIAQDIQKTFPQSVFDVDGTLNINVSGIVPPMLAAIKALTNRVEWLENIINNTKLGEMNHEN